MDVKLIKLLLLLEQKIVFVVNDVNLLVQLLFLSVRVYLGAETSKM